MINLFKKYYLKLDSLINIDNNSNINLYAHKDIVGFFVVGRKEDLYILKIYGKIKKEEILKITKLFSLEIGVINFNIIENFSNFLFIKSSKKLIKGDFLMFIPDYYIDGEYLIGPYLDNIIGNIVINKFNLKYNIFHSIDEEAKLQYSRFKENGVNIVIDTIWQDFLTEKINLDIIYNVKYTKFSNLNNKNLNNKIGNLKNIKLNIKFKTEIDFIKSEEKYYILCPIEKGHSPYSRVKLKTIYKLSNILQKIIEKYD